MIHLAHDLADATVLIVGGGRVGARRARRLAEASVLVVSPRFADADFGGATRIRAEPGREYVRELIDRAEPALVVAATDDSEFNTVVATAGREAGALVNRADRPADTVGAVDVPATASSGSVVASISTSGRSPTLSAHLRDRIEKHLEGSEAMAELMGDLRDELRERDVSIDHRRAALRALVRDDDIWERVARGGDARSRANRVIEETLDEIKLDCDDSR